MTLAKINYSGYILSGKEYFRVNFRIRNITKNKERHYITVMGWIYKEGVKNWNVMIDLFIFFSAFFNFLFFFNFILFLNFT